MLLPDSYIRATWDILMFISIIYSAIILPIRISFETEFSFFMFYLDFVVDCMFLFDILVNFNTGIYLKGKIEMSRKIIAKDYFSWWFWIDVASSMPMNWILAASRGISLV